MWQHNDEPLGGSLGLSALLAAVPILVLFVMLGVLRKPSRLSALTALVSALLVALLVYGMPANLAVISVVYGAAYGMFPIAPVVFSSIMLHRLVVETGKFEIIKNSVGSLTDDRRLQAMFIAFSFGAFIEGAAGFGAPVAVAGAMLAGLGFDPFYAAGICLLANTAPVALGSIGIPVITLANVTGLPLPELSAMVGRLCAMISVFIPGYLLFVMVGRKRAMEVMPANRESFRPRAHAGMAAVPVAGGVRAGLGRAGDQEGDRHLDQRHPAVVVPHQQRHSERAERAGAAQPERARAEPDPHGLRELGGWRDGQDDLRAESIAVAVAATGMTTADEGRLFRFTMKHSVLLTAVMGILSMFFAYVMSQWVPPMPVK